MFGAEELAVFLDQANWVTVNDYEWELLQQKDRYECGADRRQGRRLDRYPGREGSVIHTKERP